MTSRRILPILATVLLTFSSLEASPQADRVVILKADGLPSDLLDSYVQKKDPYTGKSVLPWIQYVFYDRGTRIGNFYSRGLSLSAPSWAMLDTGQPSVIKGNLEFDRMTLHAYDYLDVFSHVLRNSAGLGTATPGVQVLDEQALPLLSDAYPAPNRYSSVQLFVRGLPAGLGTIKRLFTLQNPKEWLDEWTIGFDGNSILFEVLERDLIAKLKNPDVRYLDFLIPVFDHTAHINREPEALLHALQQIDQAVGRVWTAIERGAFPETTALVLVSDHGMNTDTDVYSQGYSLINFFTSAKGGGHHVVTNRRPLGEYAIKSLSPAVPLIVTTSPDSYYLKGQSSKYPTLLLDADGNERASVYLRHSELNSLQILFQQMGRGDLKPDLRQAAKEEFFSTIDRNRQRWKSLATELREEIDALRRALQQLETGSQSKGSLSSIKKDVREYGAYLRTLDNLLSLDRNTFDPARNKVGDLIAEKSIGDRNSIYDLQNYVVGPSEKALGRFDRRDYFSVLTQIETRNNPQRSVASKPVDFIATAIPAEDIRASLPAELPIETAIWLFRSATSQALILGRRETDGQLWLRYVPICDLAQQRDGGIRFSHSPWQDRLPLDLWEDQGLRVEQRQEWLEAWHTESEWFRATHATKYSNAVIDLYEQFVFRSALPTANLHRLTDDVLILRFRERKRQLAQPDFIVFANDHWNFNYRGFNPGGNHGSFFRESTHATLMFAGGPGTGIPKGSLVETPYDALSLVPSILKLTGQSDGKTVTEALMRRGFKPFPGPVIRELF